jgi:hypothetical protein
MNFLTIAILKRLVSYLTAYVLLSEYSETYYYVTLGGDMAGTMKKRGFAAMSKEERTRIARMGGKASHGSRKRIAM